MRLVSDEALAVITIWQEARGEPYEGKVAVGEVIRNRMEKHGKGVAEIVLAPLQFSGFNTSDRNRVKSFVIDDMDPVVIDCRSAWMESSWSQTTGGATHYANLALVSPAWASVLNKTAEIGHHTFFKE